MVTSAGLLYFSLLLGHYEEGVVYSLGRDSQDTISVMGTEDWEVWF